MELWTNYHLKTLLPAFILMIIAGVILRIFLGKKQEKTRLIPFQICAVIIVILEIIKQIKSLSEGYDLYHIPLHFCSLFIFMLPITAFYNGKYKDNVRAITSAICGALFLLMSIYPALIYNSNIGETYKNFFTFHTVYFHLIATFTFVLMIALDLHSPATKKDLISIVIFIAVYCVIAGVTSQILETNFNNFYQCNVPPLENIRLSIMEKLGRPLTQTIYVIIVTILDLGFVTGSYFFYKFLRFLTHKIEKKLSKTI